MGTYMTPEEQQKWFEHNTYWSLYTTDKYVWCYSEKMNWWLDRTVPKGCADAIASAKEKINTGKPLGFDMKEITERASAKQKEEFQKKLKIKSAAVKKLPNGVAAPKIDGVLDDAAWAQTKALDKLMPLASSSSKNLKAETIAWVTYDKDNLYFAVKCTEPLVKEIKMHADSHDNDGIWLGDTVEVFIAPKSGTTLPFAHFIIDAKGVTWDAMHTPETNLKYDPAWTEKSSIGKDAWFVEAAVPWKALGIDMPKPGTELKGNICRQRSTVSELGAWSAMGTGFLEHELFGTFKFVE